MMMTLFNQSAHQIWQINFNSIEQVVEEESMYYSYFISAPTFGVNNCCKHMVEQTLHRGKGICIHLSTQLQVGIIVLCHGH